MGLDPPPGCNIASLTVPKEKLVVVRRNIAELNLTLSSGWKAAKKVHVTPRVPLNGSFSRQSLAYVQAAARYLKQVSKAVKNEVVASHTGSQTYEAVQGIYLHCVLDITHCLMLDHWDLIFSFFFVSRNIFMFIEVEELR